VPGAVLVAKSWLRSSVCFVRLRTPREVAQCRSSHKPMYCPEDRNNVDSLMNQAKTQGTYAQFCKMRQSDPNAFSAAVEDYMQQLCA
jgi:hypothetical protein